MTADCLRVVLFPASDGDVGYRWQFRNRVYNLRRD